MKYPIYFKKTKKNLEKGFVYLLALMISQITHAQNGNAVWSKLTTESEAGKTASRTIGINLGGAALFIAAVFVIYNIAENKNNAKAYAITWVVALIYYFIMFDLVD